MRLVESRVDAGLARKAVTNGSQWLHRTHYMHSLHVTLHCFATFTLAQSLIHTSGVALMLHFHTTEGDGVQIGVHRHCGAGRRRSAIILILSVYPSCPYRTILGMLHT